MKRRKFLAHTASFAGVLAAGAAKAQVRPCPPPWEGEVANCGEGGVPSWFLNAADEQWFAVPASNTGASLNMTTGMFNNYTGGGFDQGRLEFVKTASGGHQIDSRNGTYVLQLNQEAPEWVLMVNDSLVPDQNDSQTGSGAYADGTPRAAHNWNFGCFPVGNTIWLPGLTGQYNGGASGSQVWGLNRAALTSPPVAAASAPWTFHGLGAASSPSNRQGNYWTEAGSAAYDYATGKIWACTQYSNSGVYPFWNIDAATGDITTFPDWGTRFPPGSDNETRRGASFIVDGYWIIVCPRTNATCVINLSNPTSGNGKEITATGSPSYGAGGRLDAAGVGYHAATRTAYFYRAGSGKTIDTLRVPADPWNGTYSWGSTTPSGGITPSGSGQYSHFVMVNDMGNGQSALLYAGNRSGGPYMYKLPTNIL